MDAIVRKAKFEEVDILNKISIASKMYWNYPPEWLERWRGALALTQTDFDVQHIFKLELANAIIGFCTVEERAEEYEVHHLWVLPKFIGNGYGKFLLNESLRLVIKDLKPIVVEADPNAVPFYERQGFVTYAQKESYPKGRFLPLMRRAAQAINEA